MEQFIIILGALPASMLNKEALPHPSMPFTYDFTQLEEVSSLLPFRTLVSFLHAIVLLFGHVNFLHGTGLKDDCNYKYCRHHLIFF